MFRNRHVYEPAYKRFYPIAMIEIKSKEQLDNLLLRNEKLLVLFYSSWCPFCTRFVPAFDRKTKDFKEAPIIHFLLDDYSNQLWDDYEIEAVPTVIFFEHSRVSRRLDGASGIGLSEKKLDVFLEKF
jgi:thioredoxin 1